MATKHPTTLLLLLLACLATVDVGALQQAPSRVTGEANQGAPTPRRARSGQQGHREDSKWIAATNGLLLQRPPPLPPWTRDPLHDEHAADSLQPEVADLMGRFQHYHPEPDLLLYPGAEPDFGIFPGPSPPPHRPPGGEQKLQLTFGPCVVELREPCADTGSIVFYLFRSVDGRPAVLSVTDPQLPESYDPELPTKVLIHGFAGSVGFNFTSSVRQAYLLRGGFNVLVVDWGPLTQLPCYASSVVNTWQVARCAGQLLAQLGRLSAALQPRRLHLVGFSLGAHIAAFLSDDLLARTGQRVSRITGLDPALPAFASLSPSWKLDPGDADFVDVVHTNAGVLGKVEPTGHADFYVNGGSVQPFCAVGDRNVPLCSHLLAPVYFSETILDESSHWGRHCPSYGHYAWGRCPSPAPEDAHRIPGTFMGEGADRTIHGTFIVATAASYPFALGPPPPPPISTPPRPPPPPPTPPETIFVVLSRRRK